MNNFEQFLKDKSEITKQIMREINYLIEKLEESGESDICGVSDGWEYSFKKIEDTKKKLN